MSNNEYVALSKIMMTPKGVWNSQARYEILDVVTYTENSNGIGNIYVAIKNNIGVGVRPTDTSYWQCILNTSNVSISMVNVVDRINQMISDLDNKRINTVKLIDSLINAYGTPLVANTVADMQDQSKIYVYTGSDIGNYKKGYWYFYNGEAWTEGDQFSSLPDNTVQQLANLSKAMPTKKHCGNIIIAKDTVKAPIKDFKIYGKSIQTKLQSPNIAKAQVTPTGTSNGITYTYNAYTNTITANGTATGLSKSNSTFFQFNLPPGKYVFKNMIENTQEIIITFRYNGNPITNQFTGTFFRTINNEMSCSIQMQIESGTTVNNQSIQIMVIEGETAPTQFIPYYNPLPFPALPANITTAGGNGSIEIKSIKKNLLNSAGFNNKSKNGLTATYTAANGKVVVTGTASTTTIIYADAMYLSPGTYTLSGTPSGASSIGRVELRDDNSSIIDNIFDSGNGKSFTFTKTTKVWPALWFESGATPSNLTFYPQIEVGPIKTDYIPYAGVSTALPTEPNGLPGIPVASGGNYTDANGQQWICNTIDKAAGTYTRWCVTLTLDGSVPSDWRKDSTTSGNYRFAYPQLVNVVKRSANNKLATLLCTHYPVVTANASWGIGGQNGIAVADNGGMYVTDADLNNASSTVADLMAKFTAKPMTIVYALATPDIIPLTTEQIEALNQLWSNDNDTIIYINDNIQPDIQTELCSKLTPYIEKQIQECVGIYKILEGKNIYEINNTLKNELAEFKIYGKSIQNDTPTIENPVGITTVGSTGNIIVRSTNGNLFNPAYLLGAEGWTEQNGVYSGDALALFNRFQAAAWIPDTPAGTPLTVSGRAIVPTSIQWPRFTFQYSDGSVQNVNISTGTSLSTFSGTSDSSKIISRIIFTYSGSTSDVVTLSDLRISIGTEPLIQDYIAPITTVILTPNSLPGIKTASKNFAPYPYGQSSVTADGVTFTARSDGSVRVQGTAMGNAATYVMKGNAAVKAALIVGQQYKVTSYDGGNDHGPYDDCWFQVYSGDGGVDGQGYDTFTWRGSNDCNMGIRVRNGATVDTVVYPMIRLASIDDAGYAPYVGPYGVGNYIDADYNEWICDTIDKVSGTYTKRVNKLVWTGDNSEQWTYHDWSLPGFSISVPDSAIQTNLNAAPNVLCDRLQSIPNNASYNQYDVLVSMTNNAPAYHVAIRGYDTEEKFRIFLNTHNITMLYPLATPLTLPLTSIQMAALENLETLKGSTIIYTTDELMPEFSLKALINTTTATDNDNNYLGSDGQWHIPDVAPIANSTNLITSDAVYNATNDTLRFSPQTLTNEQAYQAHINLQTVSYSSNQNLSDASKTQARTNIGALGQADLNDVIKYTPQTSTTAEQKTQARSNIGALGAEDVADVIRYSSQTLGNALKEQARTNIGALSYDAQSLTSAQKAQARMNIGAPSTSDVSNVLKYSTQTLDEGLQLQARKNINAAAITDVENVLKYSEQTLMPEQQLQVQTNIGVNDTIHYTYPQNLTEAQKSQIRDNIGAPSYTDFFNTQVYRAFTPNSLIASTNTAAGLIPEFTIYGKAIQEQTGGKNLLDINDFSRYRNAIIDQKDSQTNSILIRANGYINSGLIDDNIIFEVNKTYTISGYIKKQTSVAVPWVTICNSSNAVMANNVQGTEGAFSFSFTPTATGWYIRLYANSSTTYGSVLYENLQVEEGPIASNFEPFTGGEKCPNPNSSRPIISVGSTKRIDIICAGKNILNHNLHSQTAQSSGTKFTVNPDKSIIVERTTNNVNDNITLVPSLNSILAKNQQYKMTSYNGGNSNFGPWADCRISITTLNSGYSGDANHNFTWYGDADNSIKIYTATVAALSTTLYPMIRAASFSDATWEPYNGKTISLPVLEELIGLPVDSGGNYTDNTGQQWLCNTIDKSTNSYIKRVDKLSLTSDLTWYVDSNESNAYVLLSFDSAIYNENTRHYVLCERGLFNSSDTTPGTVFTINSENKIKLCYYYPTDASITDVQSFKDWLDEHPMEVIYQLPQPQQTVLSTEQIEALNNLQSYNKNTTIYTVSDVCPDFSIAIPMNNNYYLQEKFNAIEARLAALEANT